MRKLGKKVGLEKKNLQAYAYCVCSGCPCGYSSDTYSAKYYSSENRSR